MVLATSVNLSRRLSVHTDDYHVDDKKASSDFAFCQKMVAQVNHANELPAVCSSYPSLIDTVKRKNLGGGDSMDIAFQGMPSGSAIQARRSRALGVEHHAKLQRRLTSSGSKYHYQPQATK